MATRMTMQKHYERWARAILRSLPGWTTVAPTHTQVIQVAFALSRFDKEMQDIRSLRRKTQIAKKGRVESADESNQEE